jgi:hypothetical protein
LGLNEDDYGSWTALYEAILQTQEGEEDVKNLTNKELGAVADEEQDGDVIASLEAMAKQLDLSPDEYPTWEELGEAMDELNEQDEPEEESGEVDYTELGKKADKANAEAIETLTEIAGENDLDPDEYGTWSELANALAELAPEEEEEEEEGDSYGTLADDGDASAIKKLTADAKKAGLDPDDYPSWVDLEEALSGEEEEEEEAEDEAPSPTFLAEQADDGDEAAIEALTEMATENDLDPDDYASWADLATEFEGEEAEVEEIEFVPEKGQQYLYDGGEGEVTLTITYVSRKNETVNAVDDEEYEYDKIPWSDLTVGE